MKALQKDLFFRQKASQVGDFIPRQAVSSWSYSNTQEINLGARSEMRMESRGREGAPEEDKSLDSEAELGTSRADTCCRCSAVGTRPSPSEGLTGKVSSSISEFPALPRSYPISVLAEPSIALLRGQVATADEGRFSQSPLIPIHFFSV